MRISVYRLSLAALATMIVAYQKTTYPKDRLFLNFIKCLMCALLHHHLVKELRGTHVQSILVFVLV